MSRKRPDHFTDMTARSDKRHLRTRRRYRRIFRGTIRIIFWGLLLTGVFILGIGYGRTLSVEDELRSDKVTISRSNETVQATLPTETVTVAKTVTIHKKASSRSNDN